MDRHEVHDIPQLRMPQRPERSPPPKKEIPLSPVSLDSPPEYTHVTSTERLGTSTGSGQDIPLETPDPSDVKGRWKHLFAFTRWTHAWPLSAAMVATVIAAGLKTLLAILLGQTFDVMTKYASGLSSAEETKRGVAKWCFVLFGVGGANWIANMAFLALWIAFGELQANSARREGFATLLWKDMSWFDSQEQGVSSLLVRIQT